MDEDSQKIWDALPTVPAADPGAPPEGASITKCGNERYLSVDKDAIRGSWHASVNAACVGQGLYSVIYRTEILSLTRHRCTDGSRVLELVHK